MRRKLSILVVFISFCLLPSGCLVNAPDDWKEQQEKQKKEQEERERKKKEEANKPTVLTSFAFLKENNPQLKSDIVCQIPSANNLVMTSGGEIDLPCKLRATFEVSNGKLVYNGDTLKSGDEIYCSFDQRANIKLVGPIKTVYQKLVFVPYTGLPYISVATSNGKEISSKTTWQQGIIAVNGFGKYPDTVVDTVYFRKRDQFADDSPKPSFDIMFPKSTSVLGMADDTKWSVLANYCDRTLIRNSTALFLGQIFDNLEWTPHSEFAEVVINGEHAGVYEIAELIKPGQDRLKIDQMTSSDLSAPNIRGGYILDIESKYDGVYEFKTTINSWPCIIRSPEEDACVLMQSQYIANVMNQVESLLSQGKFQQAYLQYLDMDSFVDYYLVQVLTGNAQFEAMHSVYCYKKRNGKIFAGPLNAFEYSTFNQTTGGPNFTTVWYKYLFYDSNFVSALKSRWSEKKPEVENSVFEYISSQKKRLEYSSGIDETIIPKGITEYKNGDEELSYEEAIQKMADVLRSRIAYMDELINGLK